MKISELLAGQGNVDVEGVIIELGEKRSFSKFGKELVLCQSVLQDDSGSIKLTLWNEDASRFKEGDRVIFSKFGYDEVKIEGDEFYILREDNILAIIK